MALVEIPITVARVGDPPSRLWHAVDGADVTVQNADGTPRTVYTDDTGATAATQPLKSDNGRVDGWVEGGILLRYRAVKKGELAEPEPWQYFVSGGGPIGPKGDPGEKWFTGVGAPASTLGAIGDWYMASDTGDFYEKTGAAAWTLRGNLKGPQGAPGEVTHAMLRRGSFSARTGRASGQTIPAAVWTPVILGAEDWDESGWWDTVNYRFAPQVAGYYRFSGMASWTTALAQYTFTTLGLFINGAVKKRLAGQEASRLTNNIFLAGTAIAWLNGTTDYAEMRIYHGDAAARDLAFSADDVYFQGELIAPSA